MNYIILFESTHRVIKAERLCLKEGILCQAIPVPRSMTADCGIALEISENDKTRVEKLFIDNMILGEFHQMPE